MWRLTISFICFVAIVFWSLSAVSQSVWERPANPDQRIGLIVADHSEAAEAVDERLTTGVEESGAVLVRRTVGTGAEVQPEGEPIEDIYQQGREAYFFEGADAAMAYLADELAGRLDISRRSMGDQQRSRALFDAGILLVRAHLDRGEARQAEQQMRRLVAALPAHQPDERSVPPNVVEMWQEVRQRQSVQSAIVDVSTLDADCRLALNGAVIDGDTIEVAPDRTYVLRRECRSEPAGIDWWISVSEDEQRSVYLFDDQADASQIDRALRDWRHRWDLDAVVYIGPGDCHTDGERLCVAARGASGYVELRELHDDVVELLVGAYLEE